jgi:hypothetical protein
MMALPQLVAQLPRLYRVLAVGDDAEPFELIDELAGEKLRTALMNPILEERRTRHAALVAQRAPHSRRQSSGSPSIGVGSDFRSFGRGG